MVAIKKKLEFYLSWTKDYGKLARLLIPTVELEFESKLQDCQELSALDSKEDPDFTLHANSDEDIDSDSTEIYFEGPRDEEAPATTRSPLVSDDWIETTTSTIPRPLFTAQPGPRAELFSEPNSPYQIFKKFIDEDFFGNLKLETNRYARATIDRERKKGPLNPRSHLEMWKAVSVSELKIFMAIIIHMSLVVKTRLKDYWSTRSELRTTYCRDVGMIRPRFEAILSMLHLNDNASYVAFGQPGHDPLHKIWTFLDPLVHKFKTYYYPCQPLTIDEAICPFRGRIRFRIYIKGKPHKYGIKIFELCESSSGYACNIEVYTGKQPGQGADYNSTLKLVERIAAPYFNRGHVIYFDRWFSSTTLFQFLWRNNTQSVGTIKKNRRGLPKIHFPKN
ncbi:PGBD5 [Cordylochernes scorpioides]|uniref:PGBD5 n=1 Tax=Cordylochernes scorpioides TaxID=51811 RepID=A0ABY6KEZ7_9ARAC|nr:PGBD5 [Cordylochernes scorpioides]